jgi:hypothetical protein
MIHRASYELGLKTGLKSAKKQTKTKKSQSPKSQMSTERKNPYHTNCCPEPENKPKVTATKAKVKSLKRSFSGEKAVSRNK